MVQILRGLSFGLSFFILWGWGWFPHRQLTLVLLAAEVLAIPGLQLWNRAFRDSRFCATKFIAPVRCFVVPATMAFAGRWNWWPSVLSSGKD